MREKIIFFTKSNSLIIDWKSLNLKKKQTNKTLKTNTEIITKTTKDRNSFDIICENIMDIVLVKKMSIEAINEKVPSFK